MEEEITIEKIFSILRKKSKIILFWTIFGILISSLYTFFIVNPVYQSTSRIMVNQTQDINQTITNTDIQTNLNLINTYQSIIKEPIILEEAISKTGSNLSIDALKNRISVQTEVNSLVFGVTVQDGNPYTAAELANATASVFQEKIGDILDVDSVTILSEAVPSIQPVSPNIVMNIAVGTLLGFMIGVGLGLILEFLDKRVKDSKIIEELGWTNLGAVLEMSQNEIKETRMSRNNLINTSSSLSRRRV